VLRKSHPAERSNTNSQLFISQPQLQLQQLQPLPPLSLLAQLSFHTATAYGVKQTHAAKLPLKPQSTAQHEPQQLPLLLALSLLAWLSFRATHAGHSNF
jgi:hypothetical protein